MTPRPIEQSGFEKLGSLTKSVGQRGQPLMDRLFSRWISVPIHQDWVVDAEWARIQQEPLHARQLLYLMAFTLFALLVWAAYAPLDEVARGEGRVIPSQQLQLIQSLDGGIVEDILVKEGQIVEAGDLLIRVDQTRFISSLRESRAQYLALRAETIRLTALSQNQQPHFTESLTQEAPEIVARERRLYEANLEELTEQLGVYRNQLEQRQQDLREAMAARDQHAATLALTSRELEVTRPLLKSGAVSDIEILRLERSVANAHGDVKRAEAIIQRSEAAIEEARNKMREVELTTLNRWRSQLSETSARLNAVSEAEAGLADKVKHTDILAPVRGTIQRLYVNTIGGVLTPGKDVVEIIPLDDQLIVEAKISPKDIAFIRPGQTAMIKLTAYDFSIYGGLEGIVEHISADTITDEKERSYYLVRLRTQPEINKQLDVIPGMTAQVDIITGKKTVLEYLIKPVLKATSTAMTER